MAVHSGYFIGLVDSYGNATPQGQWLVDNGWAHRADDGGIDLNDGVSQQQAETYYNNRQGQTPPAPPPPPVPGETTTPTLPDTTWAPDGMSIGSDGSVFLRIRHWDKNTQDYLYTTAELGNPQDPHYNWALVSQNTGIPVADLQGAYQKAYLDWQQTQAGQIAMKTWAYAGMDPFSGAVTVKNGAGTRETASLSDVMTSAWQAAHPGVNLQDITQSVDAANRSNWNNSAFGVYGSSGYQPGQYLALGQSGASAPAFGSGASATGAGGASGASSTTSSLTSGGAGQTTTGAGTTGMGTGAGTGASTTGTSASTTGTGTGMGTGTGTGTGSSSLASGTNTGGTGVTPFTSKWMQQFNGITNEQASDLSDQARVGQNLAAMGQYKDISGADHGLFYATDYYGNRTQKSAQDLINAGSATAGDLYQQQLSYGDLIRRYGQTARAGTSQIGQGYNPNTINSNFATG
jgi:hypothetical protein